MKTRRKVRTYDRLTLPAASRGQAEESLRGENGLWRVEDESTLVARLRKQTRGKNAANNVRETHVRKIELSDDHRAHIVREAHEHVLNRGGDLNDLLSTKHLEAATLSARSPSRSLNVHHSASVSDAKFTSPFVRAHVLLTEYRRKSSALRQPNEILTSGVINILGELSLHVNSSLADIVESLHEHLLQVVYGEPTTTPHFVLEKQLCKEVKALRTQRAALVEKQQNMKKEHERHKMLFDDTVLFWQQGLLRRTFSTWKRSVALGKQHVVKMQGIFAKWYQGDDLLRVYFTKWSAFRQAAVRQRLLDDLQKGSDDLAYHERIVAERQLILRKKREQIATLEAEYEAELKSCEALREAAASEAEHAKDVSEAKASLMKVARKLRQLVDALGSGLLRTTGTSLKQLAEAPDASSVLSIPHPFSSHDSAQEQKANEHSDDRRHRADDRLLLVWLKRTLGMLYEEDKSKHTLLHSADTVHEIVHLGMCLDLARCIPPRLRLQAEEKIPLGAVTEHMDLTTYNQDHIDIVASLMRVQTLCHGDIRGSALVRRGSALSLSRGSTLLVGELLEIQTAPRDGLTRDRALLEPQSPLLLMQRQQSSRRSLLERQSSKLMLSKIEVDTQSQAGASVASHQVASAQQDISSRFVDESLPVIAITEILDALEPEGPSDSTFLSVFLSQFFMASPLLPPLLSSEDALLQAIATIRSDFQRVTDLFLGEPLNQQRLQAQGGKSPRQLSLSRPTLANNTALFLQSETEEGAIASPLFQQNAQDEVELFLQNPESHIDAVIDIKCRLQETMRSVQLQSTKLRQDNSWESATRLAEAGVWNQLVAGVSVQTVAETENNKVKSERRKSSMTMKRRRSSGSSMSSRASHGSFVRKNGIILIMPGDVITIVEKAMQAHKLALDNVPDMILEYSKVLSILLDRYESPVDMIKEADLADLNDLSGKKYRSALNAVCSTENKTPLEIFIFALFFVADWQFDMAIEDNASADYIKVFRSRVLERLKQCSELTSGDLAVYTADQAALARQLFHRLRSKNAPVDQLSLANWKHLLDGNRWLTEKGCVTKQFLTDVFHKCNRAGEDCEKGAQGLTLTEFKRALMLVSHARFPGLFTSDKEKLAELFSFFDK